MCNVCAWHEAQGGRPHYLFRLKLTANMKRALAAVPQQDWQGPARRWFLLFAARLAQSGRQKMLQVSVSGQWCKQLRARLPASVRVAGSKFAAVENRTTGRAHPTTKRPQPRMKTQPPTAEPRLKAVSTW